jgi:hypothetical protein
VPRRGWLFPAVAGRRAGRPPAPTVLGVVRPFFGEVWRRLRRPSWHACVLFVLRVAPAMHPCMVWQHGTIAGSLHGVACCLWERPASAAAPAAHGSECRPPACLYITGCEHRVYSALQLAEHVAPASCRARNIAASWCCRAGRQAGGRLIRCPCVLCSVCVLWAWFCRVGSREADAAVDSLYCVVAACIIGAAPGPGLASTRASALAGSSQPCKSLQLPCSRRRRRRRCLAAAAQLLVRLAFNPTPPPRHRLR